MRPPTERVSECFYKDARTVESSVLEIPTSGRAFDPFDSSGQKQTHGRVQLYEANSYNKKYSFYSFAAQFVEVTVDEDLGIGRVKNRGKSIGRGGRKRKLKR